MTGAGRLVLVGTPLGNLGDLSPRAAAALAAADAIACEDTRRTRKLLRLAGRRRPPAGRRARAQRGVAWWATILDRLAAGRDGRRRQRRRAAGDLRPRGAGGPGGRRRRRTRRASSRARRRRWPPWWSAGCPPAGGCSRGSCPARAASARTRLAAVAAETRTIVLYEAPHRLVATLADLAARVRRGAPGGAGPGADQAPRGGLARARSAEAVGAATPSRRGEYVLVVEGARRAAAPASEDAIEARPASELAGGGDRTQAVAAVAADARRAEATGL